MSGDVPWECALCGYEASSAADLTSHHERQHWEEVNTASPATEEDD